VNGNVAANVDFFLPAILFFGKQDADE